MAVNASDGKSRCTIGALGRASCGCGKTNGRGASNERKWSSLRKFAMSPARIFVKDEKKVNHSERRSKVLEASDTMAKRQSIGG